MSTVLCFNWFLSKQGISSCAHLQHTAPDLNEAHCRAKPVVMFIIRATEASKGSIHLIRNVLRFLAENSEAV